MPKPSALGRVASAVNGAIVQPSTAPAVSRASTSSSCAGSPHQWSAAAVALFLLIVGVGR
jgi:hypothetical protein